MPASTSWKRQVDVLQIKLYTLYHALKHPHVPRFAKVVAWGALAYQFSPVQLIPNWVPVLGFADNVLVIALATGLLRLVTPRDVLAECRERASKSVALHQNLYKQGGAARLVRVSMLAMWILAAIVVSVLLMRLV